ncbi:TonB-dependent receptor domain-containing protein [Aliikangiella coralliicola]|uniref:TonB-dependent receptor n=1 Tax=Aliikangiella coralliicola TaxID=2592383 RepID=A0A545UAH0_9GAMM|nr:TonB-dependent receptor [Aliikangiella coralliicola]TQV86423.1 TonB-dependent receptor [Aliikangiella coralliicola]
MNLKLKKRSVRAVKLALLGSILVGTGSPVYGMETDDEENRHIVVTGSRIKRADVEGANPVQVISQEDLKLSGIANIGDIIQEIPSAAGAGTNTRVNNGGDGAVRMSLRGLSSARTLVLLNGRRIVASGLGVNASVDLSTIPVAIVKRVEVLKDGASAVYGSDAIAGVVNIITRTDFDGFEANVKAGITSESDGETRDYDFTFGHSGEKGNIVANAFFSHQGTIWEGDREYSQYDLDMNPDEHTDIQRGGSSAPPWLRLNVDNPGGCGSFTHGAANGPGQSDPTQFIDEVGYVCWDWSRDTFNYAPQNYAQTPNQRYGMFLAGNYEFSDKLNLFTEFSFSHRKSDVLLAPDPLAPLIFFNYDGATYSQNNWYNQQFGPQDANGNPFEIRDWRRRMSETGGRLSSFTLNTTRFLAGLNGEFDNEWGYEVSFSHGINEAVTRREGYFNLDKVALAVGPSFQDGNGNIVCGTPDNPITDCVSLNIFGTPFSDSGVTREMLDFVTFNAQELGNNKQTIISASMFGDLFELPGGIVGASFGLEHREESGADYPDALVALGATTGSTRQTTEGGYEIDELFAEVLLPITDSFEVDLATRYSDYSTFGDTTNFKLGLKWNPVESLLIRGTVSTAFRAPSIANLFQGTTLTYPEVTDPCTTNPTAACIADGVPSSGYEATGSQLTTLTGGSPDVLPEEAEIFTLGMVWEPDFLDGLSMTVDYWNIDVQDAISSVGAQTILNQCANGASGNQACSAIARRADGTISSINDRTTNVGSVESSGTDLNLRYTTDVGFAKMRLNWDTTFYDTYDKTLADGTVQQHAGWHRENGDGNFAEIRSNVDVNFAKENWQLNYTARYISSVEENWTVWFSQTVGHRKVDSNLVHDLRFSYLFDSLEATFGIDNVTDEDPPFVASGFNLNTDPRTYKTAGRVFYVGLKYSY